MMNRRRREAASRSEERRRREDDAPRLRDDVPRLESLRLVLEVYRQGDASALVTHTRHVVVARAPSLFVIPCVISDCDGTHDMTREVMRFLRAFTQRFEGQDECFGSRGDATCHHLLRYQAIARYFGQIDGN